MTTKTTFHLSISRPALAVARVRAALAQHDPILLITPFVVALLIIAIIGTAIYRSATAPAVAAQPTPSLPIILIATAQPVPTAAPIQVAAALPGTLRRAVVAYDAPNGSALGAIEQGRAYAVLARFGADWLQADVVGSGVVWLRSADVFDLPSDLADLQPPAAPVVIERPIYIAAAPLEAAPTQAPQQYAVTSAPAEPQINERQQNIQARLVDPSVAQEWARQQWQDEHCITPDNCIP